MATTAKKKKAVPRKKATKKSAKPAKKKFAEGGEVDNKTNENDMDENAQLQEESAPLEQSIEGVPPHNPVPIQEPVAPVVATPAPPVVEKQEEPIIEKIEDEVKPVKEEIKKIEKDIEDEAGGSRNVFAFFIGAMAALFLGVKFNK